MKSLNFNLKFQVLFDGTEGNRLQPQRNHKQYSLGYRMHSDSRTVVPRSGRDARTVVYATVSQRASYAYEYTYDKENVLSLRHQSRTLAPNLTLYRHHCGA